MLENIITGIIVSTISGLVIKWVLMRFRLKTILSNDQNEKYDDMEKNIVISSKENTYLKVFKERKDVYIRGNRNIIKFSKVGTRNLSNINGDAGIYNNINGENINKLIIKGDKNIINTAGFQFDIENCGDKNIIK